MTEIERKNKVISELLTRTADYERELEKYEVKEMLYELLLKLFADIDNNKYTIKDLEDMKQKLLELQEKEKVKKK